jgi:uncharacterized OB-fold protein
MAGQPDRIAAVNPTLALEPGLFRLDDDGALTLVGGYSPSSGRYHFPLLDTCPYTGAADVEARDLSTEGTLFGWTAVSAPPPGYLGQVPYGFGIVELPEGLRVLGRITEPDVARLAYGDRMRLVADVLYTDDDGRDVVTWAWAPATPAAGARA